jgi:hypothetical protein
MALSYRIIARFLLILLVQCSSPTVVESRVIRDVEDSVEEGFGVMRKVAAKIGDKYQSLTPQYQLIASGLTGFVITRVVANSAYKAAKIGVAAYIA